MYVIRAWGVVTPPRRYGLAGIKKTQQRRYVHFPSSSVGAALQRTLAQQRALQREKAKDEFTKRTPPCLQMLVLRSGFVLLLLSIPTQQNTTVLLLLAIWVCSCMPSI